MSRALDVALLKLGGIADSIEGGRKPKKALPAGGGADHLLAGRYRTRSLVGEGGMGRVFLVEDTVDGVEKALKVLFKNAGGAAASAGPSGDDALSVSFKREFYTLTKLQHPNTVKVFDCGVLEDGDRFLTMEFVRGRDLRELLGKGARPVGEIYTVLAELAQVLNFIHSRLFVHCDIKAENIRMTDRGGVKLMDFGLMHPLGTPSGGTLKGTVHYMAPEVPRGGIIDARTDLYSLGVLTYEMATGRFPFTGKTLTEIISQHLDKAPPPPRTLKADLPEPLERLILRCLQKNPDQRFESVGAFMAELAKVSGRAIAAEPLSQRTSYLNSAELVGRDKESSALKGAFDKLTQEGKGSSVFLSAPAGVGKTRLLQEFELQVKLADVPFVVGQCRAEGLAPLRPMAQALAGIIARTPQPVLDAVGPTLVKVVPELARRGYLPLTYKDAAQEKAEVFDAVLKWLRETSKQTPLLFVLEDLHWADSATLELVNALTREAANMRVMLLVTFRGNEVDRASMLYNSVDSGETNLVEVAPLSKADMTAMIGMMLRGLQVPAEFYDRLFTATQGNCFFTTESLRALIENGTLKSEAGKWGLGASIDVPKSIAEAVSQRLSSLSPQLTELATIAAVGGRVLDLDLVQQVAELEEQQLFGLIDEMVERQFVARVDDKVLFTHDTVRETIYARTDEARRRQLHTRFGDLLAERHASDLARHSAAIAHHYSRGDDKENAVKFLVLAGDEALKIRALVDVARTLEQASNLLDQIDYPKKETQQIAIWAKIADCSFGNDPNLCVTYSTKLIEKWAKVIDVQRSSKIMKGMMKVTNSLPRPIRRGAKSNIYKEQPFDANAKLFLVVLPLIMQYRAVRAFAHAGLCHWDEAIGDFDYNLSIIPDPRSVYFAATRVSRALTISLMGNFEEARALAADAAKICEENDESIQARATWLFYAYCLCIPAIIDAWTGAPIDMDFVKRCLALAARTQLVEAEFWGNWPMHTRACLTGDAAEYQKGYAQVMEVIRKMGYPVFQENRMLLWDALFHIDAGKLDLAERSLARLERTAEQMTDGNSFVFALTHRAQLALERGKPADAETAARAAVERGTKERLAPLNRALCLLAEALLRGNKRDEALALLEKDVLPRVNSEEFRTPVTQTIAHRLHGEALGPERGRPEIEKALEIAKANQIGIQEGFAHVALAKLLAKTDGAAAATHLDAASAAFTRIGNPYQADKVQALRGRLTLGGSA